MTLLEGKQGQLKNLELLSDCLKPAYKKGRWVQLKDRNAVQGTTILEINKNKCPVDWKLGLKTQLDDIDEWTWLSNWKLNIFIFKTELEKVSLVSSPTHHQRSAAVGGQKDNSMKKFRDRQQGRKDLLR
jgi:hypothetical protein